MVGPVERAIMLRTGGADRVANLRTFSIAALILFTEALAHEA